MNKPQQFWIYKHTKKEKLLATYELILPIQSSSVWLNARLPVDVETTFLIKLVGGFIWKDGIMVFE
jgi:hypothetical protein